MESFRDYVVQEKIKMREEKEVEKRRKLEIFVDARLDGGKEETDELSDKTKVQGLSKKIRKYFLNELWSALLENVPKENVSDENFIERIASQIEYSIFSNSQTLFQYKSLGFEKIAEIKKGKFPIKNVKNQTRNSTDVKSKAENEVLMTENEKCLTQSNNSNNTSQYSSLDSNDIYFTAPESADGEIESFGHSVDKANKIMVNIGTQIETLITKLDQRPAVNNNVSPFIPIEPSGQITKIQDDSPNTMGDGNKSSTNLLTKKTKVGHIGDMIASSSGDSMNISDIEKDALVNSSTENSMSKESNGEYSTPQTENLGAGAKTSNHSTADIKKDILVDLCEIFTGKKSNLAAEKSQAQNRDETKNESSSDSGGEVVNPQEASGNVPSYSKDQIWDIIFGPLRVNYTSRSDNEKPSSSKTIVASTQTNHGT